MHSRGRRGFLGKVLLAELGLLAMTRPAQALAPKLATTDPAAAAVGYVEDATKTDTKRFSTYQPGQNCANCELIMLQYGFWRPCRLFPGKLVSAKGWCNAWVKSKLH